MKNDPLEALFQNKDWKEGYEKGFRAGQDDMMNDMADDFDLGEEQGLKAAKKHFRNTIKIVDEWNTKKISAEEAMLRINKYLRKKSV